MNIQELTTWNRLSNLDFDAADVAFPFSARLARENGWTMALATEAIEEYRKFCFLAAHAGHPVTPSDEVDQVWHLHLTYSQHYWQTLCRDTLERPLHHGPTQGGAAEDRKFRDWYENTLASYRRYFGEPPKELWPSARERFDARHDFVRIDRRDVVPLDRALLRCGALVVLGAGALAAVANAIAQADGAPAAVSGTGLVVWLLVIGLVAAGIIAAVRTGRAGKRDARKRRSGADAAAGGAASSYVPSDGSNCPPGSDCSPAGDGGAAGCGSSSGCGGGGGGCGGGGGG